MGFVVRFLVINRGLLCLNGDLYLLCFCFVFVVLFMTLDLFDLLCCLFAFAWEGSGPWFCSLEWCLCVF